MHIISTLRTSATVLLSVSVLAGTAQTFAPTAKAANFNVFVRNNLTAQDGDTHGPVAISGNLVLAGNTVFAMNSSGTYPTNTPNDNTNYGMVIGGGITYTLGNQSTLNNGFLRLGSTSGTTLWDADNNNAATNLKATPAGSGFNANPSLMLQRRQPAGSAATASGLNFGVAFTNFAANSAKMASWATNNSSGLHKISIAAGNNPHIQLADNKINYINLTGAQLANLAGQGSIIFDQAPTLSRTLVFNVQVSGSFSWTAANFAGLADSDGAFIIWNFYSPSALTIAGGNAVYGTVYAPASDVVKTNSNNLNGQVVARSFVVGPGEVHYYPFTTNRLDVPDNSPLPLRSLDIQASLLNKAVTLNWQVAGEEGRTLHELERSSDGLLFTKIKAINGKGANPRNTYTYTDRPATTGNLYYRLQVTDLASGKGAYSRVVVVKQAANTGALQAWPNPVTDRLTIQFTAAQEAEAVVAIRTTTGRLVSSNAFSIDKGANQVTVDNLTSLAPGIYITEVRTATKLLGTQVIVKQ